MDTDRQGRVVGLNLKGSWDDEAALLRPHGLRGPIPPELGGLSNLERLDLGYNALAGSIPPELGGLSNLRYLHLGYNGLAGSIPPELGELSNLEVLNLYLGFGSFSGPIPPELGNLANLRSLSLGTGLDGPIPPELGGLSNLVSLFITWNNLSGPIPPWLGQLENLRTLNLISNQFTGSIPPELGDLTKLEWLNLYNNELTGPVPLELGNLVNLRHLGIGQNQLTGVIPRTFLNLRSLESLDWSCGIRGICVPGTSDFVAWVKRMEDTDWGSGPFCNASDQAFLTRLYEVAAGYEWTESRGWMGSPALEEWYGVETDSLGRVTALTLSGNGLSGELPAGVANLGHLKQLRINGNELGGRLPLALTALDLEEFHYDGTDLCEPADPEFRDWLDGIPSHRGTAVQCAPLTDRDALVAVYESSVGPGWTNSDGWLSEAPLRRWSGVEVDAQGRVVGLNLRDNGVSGLIPPELGGLSNLERLDLGFNALSGSIPPELGGLSNLERLDLAFNALSGSIPPELGGLSNLGSLHLYGNDLSGTIPAELGRPVESGVSVPQQERPFGRDPSGVGRPVESGVSVPQLQRPFGRDSAGAGRPRQSLRAGPQLQRPFGRDPSGVGRPVKSEGAATRWERSFGRDPAGAGRPRQSLPAGPPTKRSVRSGPVDVRRIGEAEQAGAVAQLWTGRGHPGGAEGPGPRITSGKRHGPVRASGAGVRGVARDHSQIADRPLRRASGCVPCAGGAVARAPGSARGGRGRSAARLRHGGGGNDRGDSGRCGRVSTWTGPSGTWRTSPGVRRRSRRRSTRATRLRRRMRRFRDGSCGRVWRWSSRSTPAAYWIRGWACPGGSRRRGRLAVEVREMPTLDLTVIPFLWNSDPDSAIIGLVEGMEADPEGHHLLEDTRVLLPVGGLDVKARAPVASTSNSGFHLLQQTEAIRLLEGGGGHYMGMMSGPVPAVFGGGGVAYLSGRSNFSRPYSSTIAHELGHNMSLAHAPCGARGGPDPSFPYPDGFIGAWGYDSHGGRLVSPESRDHMSYCEPTWTSDYHFTNALRYRLADEGAAPVALAAAPVRSLLLWGGVDTAGTPFLNPAFVADAPPALPDSAGDYTVTGRDANGRELFSLSFAMPVALSEEEELSSFVFALPAQPGWAGALASVTLSGPAGTAALDGDSDIPMAILRDPRTGQVRGILRGPPLATEVATDAIGVHAPGRLEVLFSRGIPSGGAWRR